MPHFDYFEHPANDLPMFADAAGTASGTIEDASAGLSKQTDQAGNVWAYNDLVQQWQLVHTLQAGETIWNLLPSWFGAQSLQLVHLVRDVAQNTPILGPAADQAYPGDKILIPNLQAPFQGVPAPPGVPAGPPAGNGPAPSLPPAELPPGGSLQVGPMPLPVAAPPVNGNGVAANGKEASWWTPGRTTAVAVGAVAAVGLTALLVARTRKGGRS